MKNRVLIASALTYFILPVCASASFSGGGFTLHQGQSYSFGSNKLSMQTDGNVVVYNGSTPLWSTGTGGQSCTGGGCLVAFQTDGNFVVYNGSTAIWASNTSGPSGATLNFNASAPYLTITAADGSNEWASTSAFLAGGFSLKQNDSFSFGSYKATMQPSGNFVVTQAGVVQWSTASSSSCASGCAVKFQSDGNLVIYNGPTAFWSSNTSGNSNSTLVFSLQGALLEMFTAQGSNLWASTPYFTPGQFVLNQGDAYVNPNGYRLTMQSDGNLVTYNGSTVLYSTGSHASCGTNTCHAAYQADGNFVIYNGSTAIWATNTSTTQSAFLSLQSPYIQTDQIVSGSCRIVYPQAYACASNQQTPISFSAASVATSYPLFSGTIGSGGIGEGFVGSLTLGGNNSDLSSGATGGGSPTQNMMAYEPFSNNGYMIKYNLMEPGSTPELIPSEDPEGDAPWFQSIDPGGHLYLPVAPTLGKNAQG